MAATEAQLEQLSSALDASLRSASIVEAGAINSFTAFQLIRDESALFDACLAAGMSFDEPSAREWAAIRVGQWLCAA